MNIIEEIKEGKVDELDLLEYITDNDVSVAIAAAQSNIATEPILDIASRDQNREVRMAAVKNPNIGKKTLQYLMKDSDEEIAEVARRILEERE